MWPCDVIKMIFDIRSTLNYYHKSYAGLQKVSSWRSLVLVLLWSNEAWRSNKHKYEGKNKPRAEVILLQLDMSHMRTCPISSIDNLSACTVYHLLYTCSIIQTTFGSQIIFILWWSALHWSGIGLLKVDQRVDCSSRLITLHGFRLHISMSMPQHINSLIAKLVALSHDQYCYGKKGAKLTRHLRPLFAHW